MVANCQVQGICAWAVVGVDVVVCVCACFGICTVVPCERFAGILVVNIVSAVVDSEVESVDVGAGGASLTVVVCVNAANGVVLSVPVVGVAACDVVGGIVMVANCQEQGVGTWTVVSIEVVVSICACLRIWSFVPSERFTGILIVCIVCADVDCKV